MSDEMVRRIVRRLVERPLPGPPQRRLEALLAREAPACLDATGEVEVTSLVQPYFLRHTFVCWQARDPLQPRRVVFVLSPGGGVVSLHGHVERLADIAAIDPAVGLRDPQTARTFAHVFDGWTSDAPDDEVAIASFAELELTPQPTPSQRARIAGLRAEIGGRIEPERVCVRTDGVHVIAWYVSAARLVRRELIVPPDGALVRRDEVIAIELPLAAR